MLVSAHYQCLKTQKLEARIEELKSELAQLGSSQPAPAAPKSVERQLSAAEKTIRLLERRLLEKVCSVQQLRTIADEVTGYED
jgi:predicted RNase H-like nuclease (RuvC/YqgF family)